MKIEVRRTKQFLPIARLGLAGLVLLIAACSSKPPVAYRTESFDAESPFQFHSDQPYTIVCEQGKRALLSQGYEVETMNAQTIRGAKFFQPQADQQLQLKISLVCLGSRKGATIYANALQTRYELKSSGTSTGLSVAGIGSVSLPWPTDKGTLVKVGEETVTDPAFYQRLFVLIESLDDIAEPPAAEKSEK